MIRWERIDQDAMISGGGYVSCGLFPCDVVSLKQAQIKLSQLRRLAPESAVFVSINPYRIQDEVPVALTAKPDGLIVRVVAEEFEGLQLAGIVRQCRELMRSHGADELPLWIVPGEVTPNDVAKLIALGASAVAIDAWCNPLVNLIVQSLNDSQYHRPSRQTIQALVSEHLWDDIDRVIGLISTISPTSSVAERLSTYHTRWAKATGAALLTG